MKHLKSNFLSKPLKSDEKLSTTENEHDLTKLLKIREERYRIILEQTNDILYEWNFKSNHIHFSDQYQKKFGYMADQNSISSHAFITQTIHPDDVNDFINWVNSTYKSVEKSIFEFRQKKADDTYIWLRIQSSPVFNEQKIPYKAVGLIIDIDEEKRKLNALESKVQLDPLTQLYNKISTQELIDQYIILHPHERHAFLLIDIDNFKSINDNLGHMFGDAVLIEIAAKVKKLFRSNDIVGRIGGDEFVVFLPSIPNRKLIIKKATEISAIFRQSFSGINKDYAISGSIGIALFNEHGNNFNELYHHADIALYYSKKIGKDKFSFYDELTEIHQKAPQRKNTTIDSNQAFENYKLHNYLFNLLYQTDDINHGIELVFIMIGERFNVSRCYFVESAPNDYSHSQVYEWCNSNILSRKKKFEEMTHSGFVKYHTHFDNDGILYCSDLKNLDEDFSNKLKYFEIKSVLQVAIVAKNHFKGFIGFDQCDRSRLWTKQDIETLSYVGKLIATFLMILPLIS